MPSPTTLRFQAKLIDDIFKVADNVRAQSLTARGVRFKFWQSANAVAKNDRRVLQDEMQFLHNYYDLLIKMLDGAIERREKDKEILQKVCAERKKSLQKLDVRYTGEKLTLLEQNLQDGLDSLSARNKATEKVLNEISGHRDSFAAVAHALHIKLHTDYTPGVYAAQRHFHQLMSGIEGKTHPYRLRSAIYNVARNLRANFSPI